MKTDETPTAKQRRVWDKAAPSYDRQIALFEKIWFGGGREWVCSRANGDVLEVAVGTGRNLPYYSQGVRICGVDLSPAMLDLARRRAFELGIEADLGVSDAEALPFPDDRFDTVVCALSLCSIPDSAKAVAEMARVLKPRGSLLLVDHIGSSWPPIRAAQWLLERFTIPTAGEHFTRRQLPLVEAAGLEVVEANRLKAGSIERIHARKPSRHR